MTPARQEASRRNGRLSRGPKTAKGKQRSRVNALKHGLFADTLPKVDLPLLADRKVYDQLISQLREDVDPQTQLELTLVESLAFDLMRLRFIHAIEFTIWEDGLPPDKGGESNALRELADHERFGTEKACRDRIELLARFQNAIADQKNDAISEPEALQIAEMVQRYFERWNEAVQNSEEFTRLMKQLLTPAAPKDKASEQTVTVDESSAYSAEVLADEKLHGAPAHGCEDRENIGRFVRRPSLIPKEFRERWRQTMHDFIQSNEEQLSTIEGYRRTLARYRMSKLAKMLDQAPRLELMSKYETMVRRNIDRTLHELSMVRTELFGAV